MRTVTGVGAAILSGFLAAGCVTGMGRVSSYGMRTADAKVLLGDHHYSIWVHPSDQTLLVQRGADEAIGLAVKEGISHQSNMDPAGAWRTAAQTVLDTAGCSVTAVDPLDYRTSWEARYRCPSGVDFPKFASVHRAEWRAGLTAVLPPSS